MFKYSIIEETRYNSEMNLEITYRVIDRRVFKSIPIGYTPIHYDKKFKTYDEAKALVDNEELAYISKVKNRELIKQDRIVYEIDIEDGNVRRSFPSKPN